MYGLQTHLRNKFLAGGLAAGPIVILVLAVAWLEEHTRPLTQPLGYHFPGLGILLAIAAVYLLGVLVTSLFGTFALGLADRALQGVPGLNQVYRAWKEILVLPLDKAGTFHQAVLVPIEQGQAYQLGFTSGEGLPGDPASLCVFLPGVPNPLTGRLIVVNRQTCLPLSLPPEEAFKFLLSTGNHVPPALRGPAGKESMTNEQA
jgi:uncharacterized membrane protein